MQKVFDEVTTLDTRCYEEFALREDILMEHAANSMARFIEDKFEKNSKVLIVSGMGNNGADGIALARLLHGWLDVTLCLPFELKSSMARLQNKIATKVGVKIVEDLLFEDKQYDVVVDCLFGSGLNKPLDEKSINIINELNELKGYKLACDIPSGLNHFGQIQSVCFEAQTTITMGSLTKSLFTDIAKEYVGDIHVANLGVQRDIYELDTECFLLDVDDLILPYRNQKTSHKGTFGHLCVVLGEKKGAALLSANAGFGFGAGLVTVITKKNIKKLPNHLMQSDTLATNTTALCIGMGLGDSYETSLLQNDIPKVIDADLFYDDIILDILEQDNIILTPHPKEFCALLSKTAIANIDIQTLQNNRFKYLSLFCAAYPNVVLLLKGANVLIGQNDKVFINTFGTSALSKGGSGDVLSGLIGSLLAQGYTSLDAAINGSLAHTLAALKFTKNNYALTPEDIIDGVKQL